MEELKTQIEISKIMVKDMAEHKPLNHAQKQYIEGQVMALDYVLDLIKIIEDNEKPK